MLSNSASRFSCSSVRIADSRTLHAYIIAFACFESSSLFNTMFATLDNARRTSNGVDSFNLFRDILITPINEKGAWISTHTPHIIYAFDITVVFPDLIALLSLSTSTMAIIFPFVAVISSVPFQTVHPVVQTVPASGSSTFSAVLYL